jgi:ParB-like chromosome segregation protein Spo0J
MSKRKTIDWRSRIVGHGKQPADQFMHHPDNPKHHPENQRAALAGAINEIGFISPVIVNKRTGYLVDGHERVWLALDTNAEVDYVEVDLSPDEEAYALVTLDPIGHLARHDAAKLDALLRTVQSGDENVLQMLSELAEANGVVDLPNDWKEFDESVADDVEYITCPHCGEKFPK